MVDSRRACAHGNGSRVRWVARRLSRDTTPSRSLPRSAVSDERLADIMPSNLHSFPMQINRPAPCGCSLCWQNREMTVTSPAVTPHRSRSLSPAEMAQAAVIGATCAAIAVIAVVVPFAAGLSLVGTVPMGLLAFRHRFRVLVAATVAGSLIAFLIAGVGGFMTVVNCAYIGGLTGIVKRRGRGTPTVVVASVVAGAVFGAAMIAALLVFSRLRHLIFASMTANVDGVAAVLSHIPGMERAAADVKSMFATILSFWP